MSTLAQEIAQIKGEVGGQSQEVRELTKELLQISHALGGDLPCAPSTESQASNAQAKSSMAKAGVAPAVPTHCIPIAATFSNTTPLPIVDAGVVTSTIEVSGAPAYLWDVDVQTFIRHTFAADLDITITSPAGTVVTLTTDNGGNNDDVFNGTIWDDDANPGGQLPYTTNNGLVTDHAYVNLELAETLVPEEALAAFVGEDPNGTWTLTISDDLTGDTGNLDQWALNLTGFAQAPGLQQNSSFTQNTAMPIPTGPAVQSSTLAVSGLSMPLCKLMLTTQLTHTFSADIDATLTSPNGTIVTLTTDNGAGNDNVFAGTQWRDDANPAGQVPYVTNDGIATDHAYVNLTTATPLVPEESMGAFMGEDGNGVWTLTISDDLASDGGELSSWTLDLSTCSCQQTADLSVQATDSPDPVLAGQALNYNITLENAGPGPAGGVSLTATLPTGTTFIALEDDGLSCTTPAVGAGGAIQCTSSSLATTTSTTLNLVLATDASLSHGSTLVLDIQASSSDTLDSDLTNNNATVTTTVTGSYAVNGVFTPSIAGALVCSSPVAHGQTASCHASLASGYRITSISSCNGTATGVDETTYTTGPITEACTVQATAVLQDYSITALALPAAGGTVSCSPASVNHGGSTSCTATANPGYTGPTWGGDCASAATAASCEITAIDGDRNLSATFTPVTSLADLPLPEGGTAQVAISGASCLIGAFNFVPAPTTLPTNAQGFPYGLASFELVGCETNGTATISITYPGSVDGMQTWKQLADLSWLAVEGASASGNSLQFSITDGGPLDLDATPGVIRDPSGPAIMNRAAAPVVVPVPSLAQWLLVALSLMLAGVAARGLSQRHRA